MPDARLYTSNQSSLKGATIGVSGPRGADLADLALNLSQNFAIYACMEVFQPASQALETGQSCARIVAETLGKSRLRAANLVW